MRALRLRGVLREDEAR